MYWTPSNVVLDVSINQVWNAYEGVVPFSYPPCPLFLRFTNFLSKCGVVFDVLVPLL